MCPDWLDSHVSWSQKLIGNKGKNIRNSTSTYRYTREQAFIGDKEEIAALVDGCTSPTPCPQSSASVQKALCRYFDCDIRLLMFLNCVRKTREFVLMWTVNVLLTGAPWCFTCTSIS